MSYADDNTPYNIGKSQCDLETILQKTSKGINFLNGSMKMA